MDELKTPFQKWLGLIKRWPKQIWGIPVLVCIVLVAMLYNPGQSTNNATVISDPMASPSGLAFNIFLKFSVVLGLIYLAYYLLRQWQGKHGGIRQRQMVIKETLHLSPRRAVHLIQVGNQALLIGATDQAVSFLAEIDLQLDPQSKQDSPQPIDFASLITTYTSEQPKI
jgi:flagellar biosynthetic protein FliO